jgi:N,N-dimethylformamidase
MSMRRSCCTVIALVLAVQLPVRSVRGQTPVVPSSPSPPPPAAAPISGDWTRLSGYADRVSVQPGDTIKFMVSSEVPRYRADIVRVIHGDINPRGPGFKEEPIDAAVNKEYPGRVQPLLAGSYVQVPDSPALRRTGSFTIQAWIASTMPAKGVQGIVTKWSNTDRVGYGLVIDEGGSLALWIGERNGTVERVRSDKPLRAALTSFRNQQLTNLISQGVNTTGWYFVAATFDAPAGRVVLYQEPVNRMALDQTAAVTERTVSLKTVGTTDAPLLIAAAWDWRDATMNRVGSHFNGKIDSPRLFGRALGRDEIDALKRETAPKDPIAAWDFSADIGTRRVTDTSPNQLHGATVNTPTRAMTGHNWSAKELRFSLARSEYGAIYFHDDDLDDARWASDFSLTVPASLKSGIYAARLRGGNRESHVPFYVRPRKGTATARIAFLVPTFNYLAYGNNRSGVPQLLSLYSYHSDGSGVSYASHLRPIMELNPKFVNRYPRHFAADLYLTNWMEQKGFTYDVITDHDLHAEGVSLLTPYKVIITGSHPEYWSTGMMDALKAYLDNGGRLMYMGGNGFYWITSADPQQPHIIEVRRSHGTEAWEAAPGEAHHSTTGEQGGLWRFRGRPPQQLVGVGFTAQGGGRGVPYTRQPGSFDPRATFIFEGIGASEKIGDFPSLVREYGAASDEVDRLDFSLGSPPHALVVATATGLDDYFQHVTEEVLLSDSLQGGTVNPLVKADMVFFETPKGGAVFTVGAISWFGALAYNNFDNTVSKVTGNVLKRFASDEPIGPVPTPSRDVNERTPQWPRDDE